MLSSPITIELVSVRLYTEGKEVRVYYDPLRLADNPIGMTRLNRRLFDIGSVVPMPFPRPMASIFYDEYRSDTDP